MSLYSHEVYHHMCNTDIYEQVIGVLTFYFHNNEHSVQVISFHEVTSMLLSRLKVAREAREGPKLGEIH